MARGRRKGKPGEPFFEKGVLASFLGCAFVAAPLLLRGSPMLRPVIQGLKTPGWIAIAIGLLLLAVHHSIKRAKAAAAPSNERSQPQVHPGSQDMFAPEVAPAPGVARRPSSAAPVFAVTQNSRRWWRRQTSERARSPLHVLGIV